MIFPPFLKKHEKVGVIAPSYFLDSDRLLEAISVLKSWNLDVVIADNVHMKSGSFSGNDQDRLTSTQNILDNPEIKAIFCVRGGYGVSRIIDKINFSEFTKDPKWIIGYSDITLLSSQLLNMGISSIHGPMLLNFNEVDAETSIHSLKKLLFESHFDDIKMPGNALNRSGFASAPLTGGNLSMIVNTLGTPSEINTDDQLLFIEEVNEDPYRIDRMLVQLKRADKFKNIKGIILGYITFSDNSSDKKEFEKTVKDLFGEYNFPVAFNLPAGHENPNLPLVLGASYDLKTTREESILRLVQW
jgi:muramoyltetrapeptide carboxypeptidase